MRDAKAFLISFLTTFGLFAATFFLYDRAGRFGTAPAAVAGMLVSLAFVVTFGISRARLGRPASDMPGFRQALFLGLTVASLLLLVGWFALARP